MTTTAVNILVDIVRHRYAVRLPGFALSGCVSRVRREDGTEETVPWSSEKRTAAGVRLSGDTASGKWTLSIDWTVNANGVPGVRIGMSGKPVRGARVTELIPLSIASLRADHLLVHGRSAGGCHAVVLPVAQEASFQSWMQQMITRRGVSLQLCQPLSQDSPSVIRCRVKGGRILDLAVSTPVAGARLRAEPLMLFADRDGHGLMEAWAGEQGEVVKQPEAPVAGWNSWDYYRWTVTEESVLKNADFIAADPVLRQHVKRIIIDDGWAYCYGEWDANPLFPHGMKWLAGRLSKMGFEPGLWFCPSIVEPHSRIAQWDSDMLAKGRSGFPCLAFSCMERYGFVLDPTVPKTRQWIHDLFDRYASMGFRYFKLDFLKPTLNAPVFADASVPRGQIVRMLVDAARQGMKGRAKLMGCGYDFHAGTALVDEVRTSSDIHARWDCIKENVGSIAARWWAQGRWWGNDPDFALARGPDTSDDPDLERIQACYVFVKPNESRMPWHELPLATMRLAEAQTLLSLVLISGGAVNLSDDLTKLNAAGLDLVRRTVAAERGAAGIALDLFTAGQPSYWSQALRNARQRLLLVNWSDQPVELVYPGPVGRETIDFWTGAPVRIRSGRLVHPLAPHACLLAETASP